MRAETQPVVVIAAAGRAKRFSGEQKVLASVGGVAAICRVANACEEAFGPHQQLVVIGHEGAQVHAVLGEAPHREYVVQEPQLGTGHALATALTFLNGGEAREREVYFLCGDKPLLSAESLRRLGRELAASGAAMAFLTRTLEGDPHDSRQGRVLQAHRGTWQAEVLAIVERPTIDALGEGGTICFESLTGHRHEYDRERLLSVRDVNISAYVWREHALREQISNLELHPEKGEYFVTDLVAMLRERGLLVRAIPVCNGTEGIGIDTQEQLVTANGAWHQLQEVVPTEPLSEHAPGEAADALL